MGRYDRVISVVTRPVPCNGMTLYLRRHRGLVTTDTHTHWETEAAWFAGLATAENDKRAYQSFFAGSSCDIMTPYIIIIFCDFTFAMGLVPY